jgi:hypothetical protein
LTLRTPEKQNTKQVASHQANAASYTKSMPILFGSLHATRHQRAEKWPSTISVNSSGMRKAFSTSSVAPALERFLTTLNTLRPEPHLIVPNLKIRSRILSLFSVMTLFYRFVERANTWRH